MGNNLVIVAIPDEDDRAYKLSSEKVPHLTLLFLGEADKVQNVDKIVQFVEHAASQTLKRFYLPVDRRDKLGEDDADALFFKVRKRYDGKALLDFRTMLLKDPNIKTAYDSAEQFEGPWVPHLTMGYPDTPAKQDESDNEFGFYDVRFVKIAVWTGDYDGPEFLLKDWDDEDDLHGSIYDSPLAAWSGVADVGQAAVAKLLGQDPADIEHHGVKGMRWGVRKDLQGRDRFQVEGHSLEGDIARVALFPSPTNLPAAVRLGKRYGVYATAKNAEKKGIKADKEWKKGLTSAKKGVEVHNKAVEEIHSKLDGFNSDKRWKDADGNPIDLNSNAAKMNEYNRAFEREVMNPAYSNAAAAIHGTSPTGRFKFEVKDPATGLMKLTDNTKIEHAVAPADDFDVEITFNILRDANGGVEGFSWPDAAMKKPAEEMVQTVKHGMTFVEGLLGADGIEHYGIKGMRWGVKKEAPSAVAPSAESKVPHGDKRKTKIQVAGGENHPAHEDAIKVAEAKAKLAKSGPAALSNAELRDVANRVQLEQQVAVLTSHKGKQFVTQQLRSEGQNLARAGFRAGVKKGAKRAVAVAAL